MQTVETELNQVVARMCQIKKEQAVLKDEFSTLEGTLLEAAAKDLEDTKNKTVVYQSPAGTATATMAESLKITYASYLRHIFGDAYEDVVTEKTDYKLSARASRMMTKLWLGEYIKQDFNSLVEQIPVDEKTRQVLAKKLKGVNFDTDKKTLITHGKLSVADATQYAYFLCEARIWTDFKTLLELNAADGSSNLTEAQIMKIINSAFVVEETPKISVTPKDR